MDGSWILLDASVATEATDAADTVAVRAGELVDCNIVADTGVEGVSCDATPAASLCGTSARIAAPTFCFTSREANSFVSSNASDGWATPRLVVVTAAAEPVASSSGCG